MQQPPIDVERPHTWLVRHGETEWARLGQHTGRTDVPLTELGRHQATAVAAARRASVRPGALQPARAPSTRHAWPGSKTVETDDDLLEWDYGADEGCTPPEVRVERPGWSILNDGPDGGETSDDVGARVDRMIARVREQSGDALLFAHAHVLRILTARWIDQPAGLGRAFVLSTATVSVLGWEREQPVVERWNEACG